ncbi:MAG: QsdR family transcriptional regulator [Solirubrobacterales bacterium]
MSGTQAASAAVFRRPAPADAMRLAREQFLAGERVEMGTLSERLGINRTTLYRWVGDREALMGTLLSDLVDEWLEVVRPQVGATGVEGLLELVRRFLELGASYEPLTTFTQREPALALRVLTDREGAVTAKANATISGLLSEMMPDRDVPDETVRAIGLVARTLVWANLAVDQEPDIEGVIELSRTLLESAPRR